MIISSLGAMTLKVSAKLIAFITSVVLARILGADGFGAYSYILSIIQILSVIAMLGLPQLIVRQISVYQVRKAWPLFRGFIRRSFQSTLVSSLLIIVAAYMGAEFFFSERENSFYAVFRVALLLLPLLVLLNVCSSFFWGLKKIVLHQFFMEFLRPALFLLLMGGVYQFYQHNPSLGLTVGIQVLSLFIICLAVIIIMRMMIPEGAKHAKPDYHTSSWLGSAAPLLFAQCMLTINGQANAILLGMLDEPASVGIFKIAQSLSELIAFGLIAVNMALAPTVSSLYADGQLDRLQNMVTKSVRFVSLFAILAALVLLLGGKMIIGAFYGDEFVSAASPLSVLCCAQIVNSMMGSVVLLLNMTGYEKITARGVAISALINVALNLLLIPYYGVMGAAIATSASIVLWNVYLAKMLAIKTGIFSTVLGKKQTHKIK